MIQDLALGARLGSGGEAEVFSIKDQPDAVVKIYRTILSDEEITRLDVVIAANAPGLREVAAWPRQRTQFQGATAIIMPLVANGRQIHDLFDPVSRRRHFPNTNWTFAVSAASNFARAVARVHAHGFRLSDVSETNALIDANGRVTLIDCDSCVTQRQGLGGAGALQTPKYLAPELARADLRHTPRTEDHDNWGVAYIIFKLLFQGSDPMQAVDPRAAAPPWPVFAFARGTRVPGRPRPDELALADVSPKIADLFEQAFAPLGAARLSWGALDDDGATADDHLRPSAAAWEAALAEMASGMVLCSRSVGHSFYAANGACPWCARAGHDAFATASPKPQPAPPPSPPPPPPPAPAPAPAQPKSTVPGAPTTNRSRGTIVIIATIILAMGGVFYMTHKPSPPAASAVLDDDAEFNQDKAAQQPDGFVHYLQNQPHGAHVQEAQESLHAWAKDLQRQSVETPDWTSNTGVNIRSAPVREADKLATLPSGQHVVVLGTVQAAPDKIWMVIQMQDGDPGYAGRREFDPTPPAAAPVAPPVDSGGQDTASPPPGGTP
jgi:DNA-binding helix-hairpin-helix protein with protein kinase domain